MLLRKIFLLAVLFLPAQAFFAQAAFKMQTRQTNTVAVNRVYSGKETVIPLSVNAPLSGLSVSGSVSLQAKNSLVRILLIDTDENEYLVYESYPQIVPELAYNFENICEETALLDGITPSHLKVITHNAGLEISTVNISEISGQLRDAAATTELQKEIRRVQVQEKVGRINQYNRENGKYWLAGVNEQALASYSEKKIMDGITDDCFLPDGLEYYIGGFFDVGEWDGTVPVITATNTSNYPTEFDWRNRHGRNWNTSIKNQNKGKNGNGCWAFAAVALTETLVNLYYNRSLDLDLSEQHIISCSGGGTNTRGGHSDVAINYIINNGIVNEECFPFVNADTSCLLKCSNPQELIKLGRRFDITKDYDEMKRNLIFNGPFIAGWQRYNLQGKFEGHSMLLVGYKVIRAGDLMYHFVADNVVYNDTIIPPDHPLIGQTAWIFKNSKGTYNDDKGYYNFIFNSMSNISYSGGGAAGPITSLNYTDADIICEDKDGDGYFYWGIGPKPATCPDCAPDEPDGDDSDPTLGPLDEWGNCIPITPAHLVETIKKSTILSNTQKTYCGDILIQSGGTLSLDSKTTVTMQPSNTITVESGGRLAVLGGTIENANIIAKAGSKIHIQSNGQVYLSSRKSFVIEKGSEFYLRTGGAIHLPKN